MRLAHLSLRFLLAALLLASGTLSAQLRMDARTLAGIATIKAEAARQPDDRALMEILQGRFPAALVQGRCMIGLLAIANEAFDPAALPPGALLTGAQVGAVRSLRIDARAIGGLEDLPGLDYVELAALVVPQLDKTRRSTGADSVQAGIHLPRAFTGHDVLIGVTDWGFDYTHPVFRDSALADTRIVAAWDQFRQAGPPPAGYGYGTEHFGQAALFAAGSDTANIYSYATHGTHVAGIAAGRGAGTNYGGVAPDAGLLFATFLVDAAAVVDAFTWMRDIAEVQEKRLVVNMSWGLYHMGTLDGTSLLSQVIGWMSDEGVVFVTSAGNNGDVDFHLSHTFTGDTLRSRVRFYSYSAHPFMWGQSLHLWGEPGADFSAGFEVTGTDYVLQAGSPWYHTATQAGYLDSLLVVGNDTIVFNLTTDAAHPLNGRPHMRLRIRSTNTQRIIVLKLTATDGTVHAWNVTELSNDVGNWGQAFQAPVAGWTTGDRDYGIGEPACAPGAIAVAAHTAETFNANGTVSGGGIAAFSSRGPTLDGRVKPDITGPGSNVASAVSSFTNASYTAVQTINFGGTLYRFARFSGTSMSSPAVAGVVALMLEAEPALTAAEVRAVLRSTARTDAQTGPIPSEGSLRWGAGKVNAYRAIVEVLGVTGIASAEREDLSVWPNPAEDVLHLRLPGNGPVQARLFDPTGRLVQEAQLPTGGIATLSLVGLAPGAYVLHTAAGPLINTTVVVKR